MFLLTRRYLALAALFFWQGGFTFYAAVVVPIGQDVLGSHLEQGFITQQVTDWLNLSGAAALVLVAVELFAGRDPGRWRRRLRLGLWVGMVLTLVGLYLLHRRMDPLLDITEHALADRKVFRPMHRLYLWTQTVQWLAAVVYLGLTLMAWRTEDHCGQLETTGVPAGIEEVGLMAKSAQSEGIKKVPPVAPSASPSHRSRPSGGTLR